MNKKIMILGAGRGQIGLYKAAKRIGVESIAVSIDGDYPGFEYADRRCIVDIRDVDAVVEAARKFGADGITTACFDLGLPAIGAVHDRLGLPGPSAFSADLSTDKLHMKDALSKKGVPTARYRSLSSADDLDHVMDELRLPIIVKPVDLWSSRGINIAFDRASLLRAFEDTMSQTDAAYCIAEEYMDGYECSATAFVAGGKIVFALPMGDVRYGENGEFPIGHCLPLELPDDHDPKLIGEIEEIIAAGVNALALDDCAVNADIMIYEGRPYILEMTGRLGANTIPELTSIFIGEDIHEWIVRIALGDRSFLRRFDRHDLPATPCLGRMLLSEKGGLLKSVGYEADRRDLYSGDLDCGSSVPQIWMFARPGEDIRPYASAADCIGQAVVTGADPADCIDLMDRTLSRIKLEMV